MAFSFSEDWLLTFGHISSSLAPKQKNECRPQKHNHFTYFLKSTFNWATKEKMPV